MKHNIGVLILTVNNTFIGHQIESVIVQIRENQFILLF
jgi:hypothetical protein